MDIIEIFGPSYCYSNEVLTKPTVIWVVDHHYTPGADEPYAIKTLLANSACDPGQHLIVFDDFLECQDFEKYPYVCYPGRTCKQLFEFCESIGHINWTNKQTCFNFMLNKVRPHRLILSRLVNYFNLTNYVYSQSWNKDGPWIQEQDIVSDLDESIVNKIFYTTQQDQCVYLLDGQTPTPDGHIVADMLTQNNAMIYEKLLKTSIYEPSFISLITEPLYHENETMITEKTIMSIFGGTIPIWVGGYYIADHMRKLGFDVFDDLIDHSYQQESTPFDRCYQSINKNLLVLQDVDQLKSFFNNNQHRFEHNLNLLTKEKVLVHLCQQEIKKIPLDKINDKLSNNLIHMTNKLLNG
jgi:hypothetical protein